MKKYNYFIVSLIFLYLLMAAGIWFVGSSYKGDSKEYLVGIERMLLAYQKAGNYVYLNADDYPGIRKVSYYDMNDQQVEEKSLQNFFDISDQGNMLIKPLYINGKLKGYIKFKCDRNTKGEKILYMTLLAMAILVGIVIAFLLYIRKKLVEPFFKLQDMPYELAKGHLKGELKEEKSRYFGKFVWGLNMLRDNLESHKRKELELEREKKLLLLSLSHDIKTPLNTIKLYAKALTENLYDNEPKKIEAARKIEVHAQEIDDFVQEIMRTSNEEILHIEVITGEFYLKDLIDHIKQTYEDKCSLSLTDYIVEPYDNKLIKGDIDRSVEVMENILENALKYGDGQCIRISFYQEDYCQLIQISNSGKPMKEGEMNHIFDSFYRGSNAQGKQGCGLGLYICRDIMRKMNGDIFAKYENDCMNFTIVFQQ